METFFEYYLFVGCCLSYTFSVCYWHNIKKANDPADKVGMFGVLLAFIVGWPVLLGYWFYDIRTRS